MKKNIFLCLIFFYTTAIAQPLGQKELKDLRGATVASCFTAQRATQINSMISDAQIRFYCSCYAENLITSSTTIQEVQNAFKLQQSSGNEAMIKVFLKGRDLHAIGNSCSAYALQMSK